MAARLRDPYTVAAVVYLIYGLLYLGGAIVELTPDRKTTFFGFVPWWVFYVIGLGLVCTLPYLVYRKVRWLTLVLSFFVAGKALTLCLRQGRLLAADEPAGGFTWLFILVAMTAAAALFRAGVRPRVR